MRRKQMYCACWELGDSCQTAVGPEQKGLGSLGSQPSPTGAGVCQSPPVPTVSPVSSPDLQPLHSATPPVQFLKPPMALTAGCHGGPQKVPLWWELLSSGPCLLPARVAISPAPVRLLITPDCSPDPHLQLTSRMWCHPLSSMALAAAAAATVSQPLCHCGKVSVVLKKGPGTRAGGRGLLCEAKRTSGSLVLHCP